MKTQELTLLYVFNAIMVERSVDGETFTDGPPIVCIPQGTWVLTALAVFLLSRIARTTSMEPAEASR